MVNVKKSYTIQEVANILLVDALTIRNWENNGTIEIAKRYAKNGYRYFDIQDIIKIAQIKGIKRLLL